MSRASFFFLFALVCSNLHLQVKMANLVTFNQALTNRCGIAQAEARDAFAADGYDGLVAFSVLSDRDIEQFVKSINKLPAVAGVAPRVPHASILRLKAMRLWTLWQLRQGMAVVHANYNEAAELWASERHRFEAELEINKPEAPKSPEKFTNFDKGWRSFKDGVVGLLSAVRGGMNIPLAYVIREHDVVTAEIRGFEYGTSDDEMMALVSIDAGSYSFKADNARVWNLIHPLLYSTNSWEHVKQFDKSKNARAAWKVMLQYGEGAAQMDTKYANAKRALAMIKYTGTSRKFPISSYLKALQGVFNDLVDCGHPYTDYEKVLSLTDGILVKDLNPIKLELLKDPYKNDYEAAIGHFKFLLNHNILDITDGSLGQSHDRGISAIDSSDQKSEWLPKEEWNKLSKEEKNKRNAARAKAKAKSDGGKFVSAVSNKAQKRQAKKKRKLARLAKEVLKEAEEVAESDAKRRKGNSTDSSSQATSSPADQFGRHSAAVKLAKMFANQSLQDSD